MARGEGVQRSKGIPHAHGYEARVVFESIRTLTSLQPERPPRPDETEPTDSVAIGRNPDRQWFAHGLESRVVSET